MNVLRRGLLVLALCLPALVPLFSVELPRSADGRAHLFRMVLMAEHLRAGEWWPRYSPELVYGYGYPLFNYYAPLTYYAGALLQLLGLNAILALHVLMALTVLVGAGGVYVLAQEWFANKWSGALAVAAYVFAPYSLFNLYPRAAVPEALAVALLPWLWWSARRALLAPTALALIRLALLYAALLLTHNLTALVGTALLGLWILYELFTLKPSISRFTFHASLTTLSLLSGLALSALFWLPAFLETNAVQVAQLTSPATLDFRNYFLTLAQLLTPSFTFDLKLEPPTFPVALGWPQFFLPLAALTVWPRLTSVAERWRMALLFGLWFGFVFLTTALSRSVWELFAPLKLIQFPWRFLGPATLCAALLAGVPLVTLKPTWARALALSLITLTALLAFPWTFITRYPATQLPPQPSAADIFAYEVSSGGYGLTSTGEFLPLAVKQLPVADPAWAADVVQGTAARLEAASLPSGVAVQNALSQRLSAQATFSALQAFTATWRWFYFPGWQAEVDGQAVPIVPSEPLGFITVAVPAGEHTVRVYFGSTPLRQTAAGLSLLGLCGLLALAWYVRQRSFTKLSQTFVGAGEHASRFTPHALLITLTLVLFVFRLAINDVDTPFRRSRFDGQAVAGVVQPLNVNFGDALTLLGFDPPAPVPADQPLQFTLYWALPTPVREDFSIAVQVWDAAGNLVGQQDAWHPNNAPTSRWLPGSYAIDVHSVTVFPGTPPGQYRLVVGVYAAPGSNLEVKTAEGVPLGREYEVATLTVLSPTHPPTEAELNPAQILRAPLGPLELIGVDGRRSQLSAGEEVPLVFYWRVADSALTNVLLQLELVSAEGTRTPLGAQPLFGEPGAVLRASLRYLVPAQAPAGRAQLQASLVNAVGERLAESISLGAVEVSVPARTFTVPSIAMPLTARFGAGMELLGYEVSPAQPFMVTLYWRAAELMNTRYKVSLQVLDATGQIVTQIDTEPVQGTRPTTSWLPPEVLTDVYQLPPLPPAAEAYTLQVVVYEPRTSARLTLAGTGADNLPLQILEVK